MKRRFVFPVFVALAGGACSGQHRSADTPTVEVTDAPTPLEYANGERLFNANCMRCHGERASGSSIGPPLVHQIYEPNHHADAAFYRAVAMGSQAHHWAFGNMPPLQNVEPEQVTEIIGYVRWLQRESGVF